MSRVYQMRMMEVDTIDFNINLTQNDIQSVDVITLDDDNKEVKLQENIDYLFSYNNNKTNFKNLSNKKIRYIKIIRKSCQNFIIQNLEAKYKNKNGDVIASFNNEGNTLCYYVGFPDRR